MALRADVKLRTYELIVEKVFLDYFNPTYVIYVRLSDIIQSFLFERQFHKNFVLQGRERERDRERIENSIKHLISTIYR